MAILQVSQSATLVGLEVPASGRPIEIKPYLIGDVSSNMHASPAVSNQFDGNVGLDLIKYGITENLTADLTVNTDFAQVEADEQQVNLTRFSLFFPEKREFFLENQGIFVFSRAGRLGPGAASADTPILFHSRQIGLNDGAEVPIIAGGRLTGRLGKVSLGLITIQTDDEPVSGAMTTNFSVARIRRDLLRRSSVGAIVTNRSTLADGSGSNQTYGVDAAFAFYENVAINAYWAKTQTTGTSGQDTSYRGEFRYNGDRYGVRAEHLFVDARFSPEAGFVRRDDFRKSFGSFRFSPRPHSIEAVRKFTWEASYDYVTDAAGLVETREARGRFRTEFESTDTFEVSYTGTYDFLKAPFTIAPDVTIPVGGYDFWSARTSLGLGQQRRVATIGVRRARCLLRRHQDGRRGRRRRGLWHTHRADPTVVVPAGPVVQLDRSTARQFHDAARHDAHDLHDKSGHVHQRADPVQLEQRRAQQQHPPAVGVSAGQRAVHRLQRAARHARARVVRRTREPRVRRQGQPVVPILTDPTAGHVSDVFSCLDPFPASKPSSARRTSPHRGRRR